MKAIIAVICIALAACANGATHPFATVSMVQKINSAQRDWVASLESPTASMTREQFRGLLGARSHDGMLPEKMFTSAELRDTPEAFDSREKWPHCKSMTMIRDQASCGSCWAFGAVESISDRECVKYGYDIIVSAEDMLACSNGGSCNGGYDIMAYNYWKKTGVVTEKCRPYSIPWCDHHIENSSNPCPKGMSPTPKCPNECVEGSGLVWANDKHKAESIYSVRGEANMMAEISTNGPCEGSFTVYDDFAIYKSGIYHHVSGSYEGGHAIKILGYGAENGVKYWICANSWNEHWGENGYFRIRRGHNDCGIENSITCGIAA